MVSRRLICHMVTRKIETFVYYLQFVFAYRKGEFLYLV